ncbi:S8 family serine peptidase [uncultured Aquimarina sp.]|uniref:fibronectin type III domain-containing protein n=1 Tax=uncultured Aquimarina sp. TaxID=575652 RepID=UPI002601BD01|nr:S8 family serine peptidase [uncultured Aquimarina sp.]
MYHYKNNNKPKLSSLFLVVLGCFLVFQSYAQDVNDRTYIKQRTNIKALKEIESKATILEKQILVKVESLKTSYKKNSKGQMVNSKGLIINSQGQAINKEGQVGVPTGIDENGNLVYSFDSNVDAATSGRTNRIWQGGLSGLNLSGAGIEIGVWESGYARATHREFDGAGGSNRVSNAGDGGSNTSHAAHTAGTLIASGVDPSARGMASGATVKNYTASGWIGEVASFAAAGGILGNNSNSNKDTSSGTYVTISRDVDDVLYNAPFYLHCKAAANQGNTYGIIKAGTLAKNVFTVANASDVPNYTGPSSVSVWTSSSYGPTNDWRIKPDIINNGRNVYSCDSGSDTDYGTKTGTSMSTPATAGTIALLQEHYKNLNGVYMRAATAKALIIDTADEVGANDGPDFSAGWGLVNAERAAQVISNNGSSSIMDELTLNNGGTYTKTVTSDGSNPLALTIAWQDPAGTVQSSSSSTPVLVNDLDVRVTGNGTTYSPWVMVPNANFNNYTDPAQRGDNFRDNVEKIDAVLAAGTYTITVTHKGSLTNGSQDFSLIANGVNANVVPDNEVPSTPANLTASNTTSSSTDLSWTASTDNIGVSAYEIFQNGTSIGTSPTNNFSITGLTAETTYSFTVNAKDAAGNVSGDSTAINITTTAPPACAGITSFPYTESFESGVGVWIQETDDDFDWIVDSGGTPSNNTGPTAANDGTNYIYTEATGNGTGFPNKIALLTSPCIDLTNQPNPELNFDYHMFGAAMGTLEIRISTDNGVNWGTIWSLSGDQGNNWNSQTVSLVAYSGNVIKLQIKGTTGDNFTSDMTIDNLSIISSVPDNEAPSAPTNLIASNTTSNSTNLSWTASTDNVAVTIYEVFRDGISIGTSASTNFNVTGLSAETIYSFVVRAKDTAGNVSGNSTVINVTTTAIPTQLFTVGTITIGDRNIATTNRRAMPYIMPENGVLQSMVIHLAASGGDMQLGVYSDNNGEPGAKLGQTSEVTADSSAGWQTVSLESPINVNNGERIWLAWIFSGNTTSISYVTGGGLTNGRYSASGTSWSTSGNNMPTNMGSGSQADFNYSIYANYTPTNLTSSNVSNDASTDDNDTLGFDLSVHPNPVKSGLLYITYPNYDKVQESKAIIRDMFGSVVGQITLRSKTEIYSIDKLSAGVYFVSIKDRKGKISSIKFIKQ